MYRGTLSFTKTSGIIWAYWVTRCPMFFVLEEERQYHFVFVDIY